jgi:hypothetical protein
MKKLVLLLLFALSLIGSPSYAHTETLKTTSVEKKDYTVYVTKTGSKYHLDGCSYLRSKIKTTKDQAVKDGYTACSRCKP